MWKRCVKNYWRDETGATAVEYGIMLAFLSLWFIVGFQKFADATSTNINTITTAVDGTG